MTKSNEIFIEITNRDIYNKLIQIENHVKETNGKVRSNRIYSRLALSLSTFISAAIIYGVIIK